MSNTKIRKITLRTKTVLTAWNVLKTSKNVTSNYIKAFWNENVSSAFLKIRGTQRLFSIKYLFGEVHITLNFLLFDYG